MKIKTIVLFVGLVTAILGPSISAALLISPIEGHAAILISVSLLGVCPVVLTFYAIVDHIEGHRLKASECTCRDSERATYVRNFNLTITEIPHQQYVSDFAAMKALHQESED